MAKAAAKKKPPIKKAVHSGTSKKAVHLDPNKLHRKLQEGFNGEVEPAATIYMAFVLQYIATEILEVSGNVAKGSKPKGKSFTIKKEDIERCLASDKDLKQLFDTLGVVEK